MFGKEATETMDVTAFDPPRSYTVGAYSCGTQYETTFRFEPEGDGTKVTLDFTGTPKTFLARLMMPLMKLMAGAVKKCVTQDLDDLKKAAEAGAMVVFTLVSPDLREFFHEMAAQAHIEAVDVIGQLIHKVANYLEATPLNRPTATMPLSEEYFRRVEAI